MQLVIAMAVAAISAGDGLLLNRFTDSCSSPLSVRGRTIGALNLYSHQPGAIERWDHSPIATCARAAAVVLANTSAYATVAERNDQLGEALVTRELIGQAQGILMQREGIDGDEAFDRLRVLSQRSNRKLRPLSSVASTRAVGNHLEPRKRSVMARPM